MEDLINADRSWVRDLEHAYKYGNQVSPRGHLTYELLGFQSVVSMINPIIYNERRKLGYKFMAAEAAWILSGQNDVATISKYSKKIAEFSDDGVTFYGAYGPRLQDQFQYIRSILMMDPESRQAVATTWRQKPDLTKDVPCTVALQFLIRNHVLHCVATMRSSDLWLGHPYDIFNFSAYTFALMLNLNNYRSDIGELPLILGNLFLTAGSKHLYQKNADEAAAIIDEYGMSGPKSTTHRERDRAFVSERYNNSDEFIHHLWEIADSERGALALGEV